MVNPNPVLSTSLTSRQKRLTRFQHQPILLTDEFALPPPPVAA